MKALGLKKLPYLINFSFSSGLYISVYGQNLFLANILVL